MEVKRKYLGLTLSTMFVVEETPALPCHVALSRMMSHFRRVWYIQPARQFEGEWYTFREGFPSFSTGGCRHPNSALWSIPGAADIP